MSEAELDRVLVIPGLNGHPGLLMRAAPLLFPMWQSLAFNHHLDLAEGGVEGLAQRALAVLDGADQRVFVCGESFGGTVALTLAHLRPERVKGLILLSAFGWHPSILARRGAGALAVWSFLGHRVGPRAYRAGRVASVPTQLGLRFTGDLFRSYISRPRAHVAAYRTKAELSLMFDARPWLASLACPTFILTGTWDPVVPVAAGRELARRIPDARLCCVQGGHLVHLVRARHVGGLISEWARDLH
ncbi:MAG: alpha/beta hydrolase [Chloroflexi bacterium]|nr:alpha/beta hydrolase [Chloroflexota bacterium]